MPASAVPSQAPKYLQHEDGSVRICIGEACCTVSSWHLVEPKIKQLEKPIESKNSESNHIQS